MELLGLFTLGVVFAQLLYTCDEKLELFEKLVQHFDILVVDWLMEQVVETKATGDDQHKALVQFRSDVEQHLVVVLQIELVALHIEYHAHLLLVEKLPDFKHIFEVVSGDLVEVPLQSTQFLLVLLLQHAEVEV